MKITGNSLRAKNRSMTWIATGWSPWVSIDPIAKLLSRARSNDAYGEWRAAIPTAMSHRLSSDAEHDQGHVIMLWSTGSESFGGGKGAVHHFQNGKVMRAFDAANQSLSSPHSSEPAFMDSEMPSVKSTTTSPFSREKSPCS